MRVCKLPSPFICGCKCRRRDRQVTRIWFRLPPLQLGVNSSVRGPLFDRDVCAQVQPVQLQSLLPPFSRLETRASVSFCFPSLSVPAKSVWTELAAPGSVGPRAQSKNERKDLARSLHGFWLFRLFWVSFRLVLVFTVALCSIVEC